jgi:hypothetical protein
MTYTEDITLLYLEIAAAGEREYMHIHMNIDNCGLSNRLIIAGLTGKFSFQGLSMHNTLT